MKAVSSAVTWAIVVALVALALPTMLLIRLFDWTPTHNWTGRTFRVMGSWITRVNPAWHITVGGTDPATLDHPYVVVANHQSQADIPLVSRLPWEMKWVGKKELFDIPVMGWLMKLADDIPVDRKDPKSRGSVLLRAQRKIEKGTSVMFFAEGTRSRDGRVKKFHDGAFRLAIQAGVPVLPVALDGTMDALPKHGWQFSRADVRLAVLDPVPTDGLSDADLPDLRERVRAAIVAQVAAWRGVPEASVDALAGGPEPVPTPGEERAKSAVAEPRPGAGG